MTSGTYKQSDANGFDDTASTTEPFTESETTADDETLSDSGTKGEKQQVDDVESDSGSGSFSQSGTVLSTSGTYSESDSWSDDTDDSESGSGDDASFYLGPSPGGAVDDTLSVVAPCKPAGAGVNRARPPCRPASPKRQRHLYRK